MEHPHPFRARTLSRFLEIKKRRGFTLTELIVVLAIITFILAVAISSQNSFNKTLVTANTAYDVALALRSAETFGMGGRASGSTNNIGYGMHFEKASPNSMTLFADSYPLPGTVGSCHGIGVNTNAPDSLYGNCVYDPDQSEKVTTYILGNGMIISDFCAQSPLTGTWSCATSGDQLLTSLDIVFARPNPTPFIRENGPLVATPAQAACITVSSPSGTLRYVSVSASGQINATATSCP